MLYTAGWSCAYHYFQQFHLGLIGLEIEREYFLLYGFWVCKARFYSVLLCLLAGHCQRRAVIQIGGPMGLLILFIVLYQLGAWTGQAAFAREQDGDFPSYPRGKVWLKNKQDARAARNSSIFSGQMA